MIYSDQVIEEVMVSNDIIDVISQYTQLKQKGSSYFGLCPFHNEKTPSFSVSPDKQLYYCFGCGASGNVYSFIMQKENHSFPEAVKILADRVNYTLAEPVYSEEAKKQQELKETIHEIHKKAARYYYELLNSSTGQKAMEYLENRRINNNSIIRFGLGYSGDSRNSLYKYLSDQGYNDEVLGKTGLVISDKKGGYFDRFSNRLMFPIFDVYNNVIAFGGRAIDSREPKYLNSPDTIIFDKKKNLYSINFARKHVKDNMIIVEGYMDVISLYQQGIKNVTAALGTAFNKAHARLASRYCKNVTLLFDSDEAGEKAALRAIPILVSNGLNVKILQLEGANDPDDYINEFGRKAFKKALDNAVSHVEFEINTMRKQYNLNDPTDKIEFTQNVAVILSKLDSAIERDVFVKKTADITDISVEAIRKEIDKHTNNKLDTSSFTKYKNKPLVLSNEIKGLDDARRNILFVIATMPEYSSKLRNLLTAEEFISPFYIKLYNVICGICDKKGKAAPAEIINHFSESKEHKIISGIFTLNFEYKDSVDLHKALNDQLRLIKSTYLDQMIANEEDLLNLQKLVNERKSLKTLYITGLDG